MVGRIGKVRKLKQINVLKIPSLEQFISENQKEQIEEMKYIQRIIFMIEIWNEIDIVTNSV